MSRIAERFAQRRTEGRAAFVPFLTAGDPSLDRTVEIALQLDEAGADVLELGVPFSDPLADGPVIQRSSERALQRGVTLESVLDVVRRIRRRSELPLLLFSYFNPLLQRGLERLATEAKEAGVDGALVTDLPPEEAGEWIAAARAASLDTVFLAAPTSPPERLRRVAEASRGFVYAVSRTGVTGERQALSDEAAPLVERLHGLTDVPVALGGERRVGLYESTEPLFLPTLGERLGDGIEAWLLDLYLDTGILPSQMLGVIAWWGLEAAQDGLQIEGYRLPEGGEAMTQRLLDEVFLVRPAEVSTDPEALVDVAVDPIADLLTGVEFGEEEIAGHMVTTLDYGGSLQYIYSSADTIWVISDPLGERAKVEEAIEALP